SIESLGRLVPPIHERSWTMRVVEDILKTHPRGTSVEMQALARCIEACHKCELSCTACADACLAEDDVAMLRRCIRLNLDCADACMASARMLARMTETDWDIVGPQIDVMRTACRLCAQECEQHAEEHEHCRICAEA